MVDWLRDYWIFVVLGILVVGLLLYMVWGVYMNHTATCDWFANFAMKDMPVRCVEYWQGRLAK